MNDAPTLDMLLCIVPKISPEAPTVGPALLKAHIIDAGYTCEVLDLNVKLYNFLQKKNIHKKLYFEEDGLFRVLGPYLSDPFLAFYEENKSVFLEWIELIKIKNPKYVGLSLLSSYSQAVGLRLSELLRQHLPEIIIVWGGPQVSKDIQRYVEMGVVDHYISGDGELAVVELLRGNLSYPGINSQKNNQETKMDDLLVPNYDDIDWTEYEDSDFSDVVYITGSRGCVRRCSFCDVSKLWPKYRYRSEKSLIEEIATLHQKYGRNTFKFTDSLINGGMKSFRLLLHEMVEYRKSNPDFQWISQWIMRPKNFSPEEDFQLLKDSGCIWLEIGLESFSEKIRYHMGKKFSNEDVWWNLDMLLKYQIHASLLMIVGYPTETEEDHQMTLDAIKKLYGDSYATSTDASGNNLLHFSFSNTLLLDQEAPLWDMVKDEIKGYKDEYDWDYRGNTMVIRVARFNEIHALLREYKKFPNWQNQRNLRALNEANLKNQNMANISRLL